MRATGTSEAHLVAAAQAGDRRALDELVATGLPLVHTIVRRTLGDHPDADDVVQETMVRAVRQLPTLQSPASFRAWLASIAVHQVGTQLRRRAGAADRTAPLEEAAELPAEAGFEEVTALRIELSRQRRQVVRAGRWLDPDDRMLLALWWLEVAGELSRAELAAAMQATVAHAGVLVQRLRRQVEVTRGLVAALEAQPRCARLQAALRGWDGTPGPLWRKRIARHTRSCAVCQRAAGGLLPADGLLGEYALAPVPIALTSAVFGKLALAGSPVAGTAVGSLAGAGASAGAAANVGGLGQLVQAVIAHPVATAITAGVVATGAAVTVTVTTATAPAPPPAREFVASAPASAHRSITSSPSAPPPAVTRPAPVTPPTSGRTTATVPPAATTVPLAPGRSVSLEAAGLPGSFAATVDDEGFLARVGSGDAAAARRATFAVVAGLANAGCVSFRADDGRYLRHASWRVRLDPDVGTSLFRGDATFCPRPGAAAGSVLLEAGNYPGWFVHRRGDELWVDQTDGTAAFRADGSFRVRPPLGT